MNTRTAELMAKSPMIGGFVTRMVLFPLLGLLFAFDSSAQELKRPGEYSPTQATLVDHSIFSDWQVVAVFNGVELIPTSGWKFTFLPDTYGENFESGTQRFVSVLNASWKTENGVHWTELKSSPPGSQMPDVVLYAYLRVEADSAVLRTSETPVDLAAAFIPSNLNPASRLMILRSSPTDRTERTGLINTLYELEKEVWNLSPLSRQQEFSAKNSPIYGGLYKEVGKRP